MTEPVPGSLFDVNARGQEQPLLLVTNRFNLLEFLSSGLLVPRDGIIKYYTDLLEICPGRIPLTRGPVTESLAAAVSVDDATAFPVALSMKEPLLLTSEASALAVDGSTLTQSLTSNARAIAPAGLIPLTNVIAVHFRTEAEMEEHLAHPYENVRPEDLDSMVSPELFRGPGLELESVRRFLESLEPVPELTTEALDHVDRESGALAMLAAVCPPKVDAMTRLAALLNGDEGPTNPVDRWRGLALGHAKPRASAADAKLFAAACEVLRNEDRRTAWRPLEVLARIEDRTTTLKPSKKDSKDFATNLNAIRSILRNERDFKAFEPGQGLTAAKGLLLVLLRPDPVALAAWDPSETGADDAVTFAAGALAGLLHGHKRLSVELRTRPFDGLLADRASRAVAHAPDVVEPVPSRHTPTVIEEPTHDGGAIVRIVRADEVLVERHRKPPTFSERLLDADLTEPANLAVALEICRRLGWDDCVTTAVVARTGQFTVAVRGKSAHIKIDGLVDVDYLIDTTRFRARVTAHQPLDAEIAEELGSQLVT